MATDRDATFIAHCYTLACVDTMLTDEEKTPDEAHAELVACGFDDEEAADLVADSMRHTGVALGPEEAR